MRRWWMLGAFTSQREGQVVSLLTQDPSWVTVGIFCLCLHGWRRVCEANQELWVVRRCKCWLILVDCLSVWPCDELTTPPSPSPRQLGEAAANLKSLMMFKPFSFIFSLPRPLVVRLRSVFLWTTCQLTGVLTGGGHCVIDAFIKPITNSKTTLPLPRL